MLYREDDRERIQREKARQAIAFAMESRWAEAAAVNREILDMSPGDLEACNRLGKALMEMGDTEGARHAFARSLEIDSGNAIARKNLDRLAFMPAVPKPAMSGGSRLAPRLFISDSGKTAQIALYAPAPAAERPFLSTGVPIVLERRNCGLAVCSESGEYLGMVPPKLGQRLITLMDGGNKYEGAVFSSTADTVKVILRETYQHPAQRSKISFPASEPGPELEAPPIIADDIDADLDTDQPERPIDLAWLEEDDEASERSGSAVGNVLDGGIMEDPMFADAIDED